MFKFTLLSVAALAASIVSAETAYFSFETYERSGEFVFQLTDDAKIEHARKILSGGETERIHVHGRIVKQQTDYNPRWNYHLDPQTIDFFDHAIEVCDATLQYTEDNLDEVCGAFLPGCHFCPWTSKLTKEVEVA